MRAPRTRRTFLATVAASLAALGLAPRRGGAQPSAAELLLFPPPLVAGDRKTLRAELLVRAERIGPVMLTPAAEGSAVEVVRGRLTRADAERFVAEDGRHGLRFTIPLAAHTPGISVVRVQANLYGCDDTCSALEARAQVAVRVRRQRT